VKLHIIIICNKISKTRFIYWHPPKSIKGLGVLLKSNGKQKLPEPDCVLQ